MEEPMSPRSLKKRIDELIDSISYTSFNFTRRGLFEKHKTIVATMLTFRILLKDQKLSLPEVEHLIIGKIDPNPPPLPEPLKGFLTDVIWSNIKGLESVNVFNSLGSSVEQ